MKNITILGSTGSIGRQTIEVIKALNYKACCLAAYSSAELIVEQAKELKPFAVCLVDEARRELVEKELLPLGIKLFFGNEGLIEATKIKCDIAVNAVTGIAGLEPTMAAIEAGNTIALANKETLVAAGELVMKEASRRGVKILPVDSEHSAIFQSMQGNRQSQVKKIILTASGGPFYGKTKAELENVTVEQALKHPNWSMGAKVTIDSATLMNKGLELIEACRLFDKAYDEIEIVVHRESVVHSLVEYDDNSVIGQLSYPDMKLPIQYALTYPEREVCGIKPLSLTECGTLTFSKPDSEVFICLKACVEAAKRGGLYPAIVNGANEAAVELFLNRKISFLDIGRLVYGSLSLKYERDSYDLSDVFIADRLAREYALANA